MTLVDDRSRVSSVVLRDELRSFIDAAHPPRRRSLRAFAESEIVIPDGEYEGLPFRIRRQPFFGILLDAIGSGFWSRMFWSGCVQSGKTLVGMIVLTWLLFEMSETTIFGLPDINMASDKWREDIKPVIQSSPYRRFLPKRGQGARGGDKLEQVVFANGRTLKFMSSGGGDAKVSAFTSRNVLMTEVDKMAKPASSASVETDKVRQLEARTESYKTGVRIMGECTVTVAQGRTWQEITRGTDSRIAVPCPYCETWVTPEREHLVGWQDAGSKTEAADLAHFVCPACGAALTEQDRASMNAAGVMIHRGQHVEDGVAVGDPPATDTLPDGR